MPTLQELRTHRTNMLERARSCQTRMEGESKKEVADWTPNERDEFQALMVEVEKAEVAYNDANKASQLTDRLKELETNQDNRERDQKDRKIILPGDQNHSTIGWQRDGSRDTRLQRSWQKSKNLSGTPEYDAAFKEWVRGRDMQAVTGLTADNEERAGLFRTSETFMTEVIKNVDDSVFVQGMSRVIMMPPSRSLGARVRRTRASTFAWVGENQDMSPLKDTSLTYGKRFLTPNAIAGSIDISRDLLNAVPSAEGMVIEEIGIDLNYKLEPAFISGDGNFKPLGLMTAHVDGISTGRDQTSGATAFTFDDWVNLKYSLKGKYRGAAKFMLHRYVLNQTALLKDGMGQYLWQPSRQIGSPDMILGTPIVETEWMPYLATSGNYYAIIGDFSHYWIVYEMSMTMQRLIETKAKTNEFEYYFRAKLDAQPMLEEAFSRGKRA